MSKVFLILILVVFFINSALAGDSATLISGNELEPEKHQVKHRQKNGEPPAHAPANGYRTKYQYSYYPSQNVYHDPDRGLYFYLKGDDWEVGATLPSHLRAGLGESVTLDLETDKPYVHNAEHANKYPSEAPRKAKKNIWSKLIFVLLYEHASK
jgi:hypothetical protein